jgi:hypothetical protein
MEGAVGRTTRTRLTLAVLAAASLASLVIAASASAASASTIEAESVSHITATDATIEAQIDPGGLETTYEVWVGAYPECIEERLEPCESTGEGPAGTGAIVATIPASSSSHTISVDIAKAWHPLSPSSSYVYHVDATNSNWAYEGSAYGENKVFETAAASAPLVEGNRSPTSLARTRRSRRKSTPRAWKRPMNFTWHRHPAQINASIFNTSSRCPTASSSGLS